MIKGRRDERRRYSKSACILLRKEKRCTGEEVVVWGKRAIEGEVVEGLFAPSSFSSSCWLNVGRDLFILRNLKANANIRRRRRRSRGRRRRRVDH